MSLLSKSRKIIGKIGTYWKVFMLLVIKNVFNRFYGRKVFLQEETSFVLCAKTTYSFKSLRWLPRCTKNCLSVWKPLDRHTRHANSFSWLDAVDCINNIVWNGYAMHSRSCKDNQNVDMVLTGFDHSVHALVYNILQIQTFFVPQNVLQC